MKNLSKVSFLFFLLLLIVSSAVAQTSRGTVTGSVIDPSGAVVPAAKITLTESATGISLQTTSNAAGIFRFDAVLLGTYKLSADATGFATSAADIVVQANQTTNYEFKLAVGGKNEVVNVDATLAILQTEDAQRGANLNSNALVQLPLGGQNALNLILVLPGVVKSNIGFDAGIGSVNGARSRSNYFMIDGGYNNDLSVAGPMFTITNADSIQEVSVQTSNFSAEYGRSGGAVINQVTKSGSNSLHGTIAEVYRTELFNASNRSQRRAWFAANAANKVTDLKPKFKENIPAFTIGGPVFIPHIYDGHSKTFFFAAGQWDRYSSGGLQQNYTVPTDAGVSVLQSLAASCPNIGPYLQALGTARGASTGAGVSSIDISIPTKLASSTCAGGARAGQAVQVGTFTRTVPSTSLDNNHLIRVDHIASERQNMTFRWLYDDSIQNNGGNIGIGPAYDVDWVGKSMSGVFNHVYMISNTWTNEFRFNFNRYVYDFPLADPNGLGAKMPDITIGGTSNIFMSANFPQGRIANTFQYQDTMSKVVGKHSMRFGAEILRQLARQIAPYNSRGQISYATTSNNTFTGGNITSMANWIDDYSGTTSNVVGINFGSGLYRPNLFNWTLFFNDNWKMTPNLTVNLGLRYENFGQPANIFKYPAFNGFSDADATSGSKVNPDNNNFGPTVGFAYSPQFQNGFLGFLTGHGKAVIRGGYQVSYDTWFNNLFSNMAAGAPNTLANLAVPGASTATTPRGVSSVRNIFSSLTPSPITPLTPMSSQFGQNIRNPYTNRLSFGVQRETFAGMVMDLSYVGALSRQLLFTEHLNPTLPNSTFTGTSTLRLYPNRGSIQIRNSGLNASYNAMQVGLRKPVRDTFFGGIGFTSNYTWSRNMDILSETFGTNMSPQNPSVSPAQNNVRAFDWGPSDNDRRHNWTTTLQWNVRGPKQGFLGQVLGGWSVAPIITLQSGSPFTPINGIDRNFDGTSLGDRPDIGNWNAPFTTRAQTVPTSTCSTGLKNPDSGSCVTANDVRWVLVPQSANSFPSAQTARRNAVYTTGFFNVDANILKTFKLTERWKFEYRAEVFNLTNNENFNTPSANRNISTTTAGNFLNTQLINGGNRSMRMGVKLIF